MIHYHIGVYNFKQKIFKKRSIKISYVKFWSNIALEVIKVRWYFIFNKVNIATNRRRDHYAGSLQETEVVIFAIRFTWVWSVPISAIFECWSSIHFWPVSFFLLWWLIFVFVFFFFVPKYYSYFRIKKCLQIKF